MSVHNLGLLKDANNETVPQVYDPNADSFIPQTETVKIKINDENNPIPVEIKGGNIRDIKTGSFTVTFTAKELKVGSTALVNRKQVILHPPSEGVIYWGNSSVTNSTGLPLSAGQDPVVFDVDNASPSIFVCTDGAAIPVRVGEIS